MATMGDRLRTARQEAGFDSARAAALRHRWTVSTYSAHENGQNDFDEQTARLYGKAFKVSAGWLMTGEGPRDRKDVRAAVALIGYVAAGATAHFTPAGELGESNAPDAGS